jgi:hypothetical protein
VRSSKNPLRIDQGSTTSLTIIIADCYLPCPVFKICINIEREILINFMIYFIKPPTAAFDPPTILLGKSFKRLPHPSGFKILVSFCD